MPDGMNCCERQQPYYITAYGLAVKRGYEGTLDEWLESLKSYIHIKYANTRPTSDEQLRDNPGDWMGICVDNITEASGHYADYKWFMIKGAANAAKIAPAYEEKAYQINDIVSVGDNIYICRQDIASGEAFNPAHWINTTLSEALIANGIATAVSYEMQELSEQQKRQARANIGALTDEPSSITPSRIQNSAVVTDKLADGAVNTAKLGDKAVTTAKIADEAITTAQIARNTIIGSRLATPCITAPHLSDGVVVTGKIADGAVTGRKLNLSAGDLPVITLVPGVHYFSKEEDLPKNPAVGRIAFVKRGG